jgi:hypothetical protein
VLVAATVFSFAGVSLLQATVDATRVLEHTRRSEQESRRADAFFHAVTLWDVEDLDRHLGERAEGPWRLMIQHPTQSLYVIALADSTDRRLRFRTIVFRATHPDERGLVSK